MNRFLRDPIYITLKYLYPKMYRIDNIQNDQLNIYKPDGDCVIVIFIKEILILILSNVFN